MTMRLVDDVDRARCKCLDQSALQSLLSRHRSRSPHFGRHAVPFGRASIRAMRRRQGSPGRFACQPPGAAPILAR
jgi:hypothetical protein